MPAKGDPARYRITDIFQALGGARKAAQDGIERLIDWSTIDCDQDAAVDDQPCDEEADREPSLVWAVLTGSATTLHAWKDRWRC